jgi:hypothetical protein
MQIQEIQGMLRGQILHCRVSLKLVRQRGRIYGQFHSLTCSRRQYQLHRESRVNLKLVRQRDRMLGLFHSL